MSTLVLKHLPTITAKDGDAATAVSFRLSGAFNRGPYITWDVSFTDRLIHLLACYLAQLAYSRQAISVGFCVRQ